jgi:hypothetical protein
MSLKGRGQGVERGTSTRSLMRSIFFSLFGRALPKEPLNRFPRLVFLSPRPQITASASATTAPAGTSTGGRAGAMRRNAVAAKRIDILPKPLAAAVSGSYCTPEPKGKKSETDRRVSRPRRKLKEARSQYSIFCLGRMKNGP